MVGAQQMLGLGLGAQHPTMTPPPPPPSASMAMAARAGANTAGASDGGELEVPADRESAGGFSVFGFEHHSVCTHARHDIYHGRLAAQRAGSRLVRWLPVLGSLLCAALSSVRARPENAPFRVSFAF